MRISIILSLLLCLVLLSTGCGAITNDDNDKAMTAWKTTVEGGINSLKTTVATLQAQIAERPTNAQVDQKIAAAPAASTNSYKKDETYNRTETDSKITAAIQALKDDANAPWTKKTTGTQPGGTYVPTTPGGTSPLQTYSVSGGNGAVQIALQGYAQPLTTSTTPVNQSYFVTLTNTATIPQYFVPTVSIQPYTGTGNGAGIAVDNVTAQYGTYNLIFNAISCGTPCVLATTNAISGGYTGGAIYVGPGVPGLMVVTITGIVSTVPANWNISISGSSSNVY